MGFGVRTGFETSRMLPLAFTFRFIDLYSQIDADASKGEKTMLPHCSPGSWLVCRICLKLSHIRMAALALLHEGQFREFREFAMFHEELPIRF